MHVVAICRKCPRGHMHDLRAKVYTHKLATAARTRHSTSVVENSRFCIVVSASGLRAAAWPLSYISLFPTAVKAAA